MLIYRQGDIAFIEVSAIPEKATEIPCSGKVILAEGEATGHAHTIDLTEADVTLYGVADEVDRWLRVRSTMAPVRHDEHGVVDLPQRSYVVRRQREYAPGAIRRVAD